MSIGPGKYDDLCTLVREKAKSKGAIVVVFEGELGNGFSMQLDGDLVADLPAILETMAAQIRRDSQH